MLKLPIGEDDLERDRRWGTLAYHWALLPAGGCKSEPAPFEAPLIDRALGHSSCRSSVNLRVPEARQRTALSTQGPML